MYIFLKHEIRTCLMFDVFMSRSYYIIDVRNKKKKRKDLLTAAI